MLKSKNYGRVALRLDPDRIRDRQLRREDIRPANWKASIEKNALDASQPFGPFRTSVMLGQQVVRHAYTLCTHNIEKRYYIEPR